MILEGSWASVTTVMKNWTYVIPFIGLVMDLAT